MNFYRTIGAAILAALVHASAGHAAAPKEQQPKERVHSGVVTFAKTAGGYTYLKIKEAGKEEWLAALPLETAVGDKIEYIGGDIMKDFKSKAMNQTFASIHFVSRIHVVGKDMPRDAVHKGVRSGGDAAPPPQRGEIARVKDGKTIEEIFSQRTQLAGKKVTLRARVVKISRNILGKNWVTLSDGTGTSPADMLVTVTKETPAVGDVITASGTVKTDVNLGSGYQYKALLEDTHYSK